jgi:hypothetical protein
MLAMVLMVSNASFYTVQAANVSNGEPGRGSNKPNPLKNVYFGEQHLHTCNSFDAFTVGVTATWGDAYRFVMGEEITLSTTARK